jgi:transposase
LAFTDDVERFAGGKEYCGYFGVTPKLDESGDTRHLGHISKKGSLDYGRIVRHTLGGIEKLRKTA